MLHTGTPFFVCPSSLRAGLLAMLSVSASDGSTAPCMAQTNTSIGSKRGGTRADARRSANAVHESMSRHSGHAFVCICKLQTWRTATCSCWRAVTVYKTPEDHVNVTCMQHMHMPLQQLCAGAAPCVLQNSPLQCCYHGALTDSLTPAAHDTTRYNIIKATNSPAMMLQSA